MTENVLVEALSVFPSASEPPRDGRLTIAEDAFSRRKVQPFGQRRENHDDLMGRDFQTVEGRVASSTEGGAARLTPKGLNLLGTAMLAIADQRVLSSVSVAKVRALPVLTGVAFGRYPLGSSSAAFHLAPGSHRH